MMENGTVFNKRKYPSPVESVEMYEITYWSEGLRVKGLLAKPKFKGNFDALLYLRGGLQSIGMVRPARIAQFALQGFIVLHLIIAVIAVGKARMNLLEPIDSMPSMPAPC